MESQWERTELLLGKESIEKIKQAKVAVIGLGGVGSFVVEGLVRAGVKKFVLVDHDIVSLSNLNRQLIATHATIGKAKVEVAKERILSIQSEAQVVTYQQFFLPETVAILEEDLTYIVDAVDTVTAKIALVMRAQNMGVPIISCMGTGNKIHPKQLEIADIYQTSVCPLAKVMRKELRSRGVKALKVLYSKEEPIHSENRVDEKERNRKACTG